MLAKLIRQFALVALLLILVLSVAAIVLSLAGSWIEDDQAGTALYTISRVENDPVIIQGYVSTDRATPKDKVSCWFHIQNAGEIAITNVKLLNWQAPGFPGLTFDSTAVKSIPAKKSWMVLSKEHAPATSEPVKFNVTAEFTWTVDGAERRRLVTVGPVTVRTLQSSRLRALSKTYVGYLKDLAVPVVIVWLTIAGGRLLQQSELKRSSASLLLERVRAASENHYLTLVACARRAVGRLRDLRATPSDQWQDIDIDRLTFDLLQLFRNLRDLANDRGGYILADKRGEDIVAMAMNLVVSSMTEVTDYETRIRAVSHVQAKSDFAEFKDDALPHRATQDFRRGLRIWISSASPRIRMVESALSIFAEVLSYELNVAYFSWYEQWPELEVENSDVDTLRVPAGTAAAKLAEKLDGYRKYQPTRRVRLWK